MDIVCTGQIAPLLMLLSREAGAQNVDVMQGVFTKLDCTRTVTVAKQQQIFCCRRQFSLLTFSTKSLAGTAARIADPSASAIASTFCVHSMSTPNCAYNVSMLMHARGI